MPGPWPIRPFFDWPRPRSRQTSPCHLLSGKTLNSNQIEFIDLIVNHLTEHGVMEASLLYESPFTDITPHGPDALFPTTQVDELVQLLSSIRSRAVA